jgi:hypothetical protein
MTTIAETDGKTMVPARRCLRKKINSSVVYKVAGKSDTAPGGDATMLDLTNQ